MEMIMIPKPGKDHRLVKGWRPIVLAQTVGKLSDKLVADDLQNIHALFHDGQYGSRRNRSGIDVLMLTMSTAMMAIKSGMRATLLGKDIVAAFNHLRREGTLETLRNGGVKPNILSYIDKFLQPRTFNLSWEGKIRGLGKMGQGTPPLPRIMALLPGEDTESTG